MKPGTLIVIGVVGVAIGLVPPIGWMCIMTSLFCLYLGFSGLEKEFKEQRDVLKDNDKEGPTDE